MVSIGLPEKAQALIQHLELEKYGTHTMLYVDDVHNTIYDALQLNRGLQRTFFHIATPYSFLQRIKTTTTTTTTATTATPQTGMKNLVNVLAKWKDAIYIPPKQSQALLQGGTFVLRDQQTLYAHYDPSTAAHAPIQTVLDIALKQ